MSVNNGIIPEQHRYLTSPCQQVLFLQNHKTGRGSLNKICAMTVAENGRQDTWCGNKNALMTPSQIPVLLSLATHSQHQLSPTKPPFPSPTSNARPHSELPQIKASLCSLNSARKCRFHYLSLPYTELLLPVIWSWTVQYLLYTVACCLLE